MVEDKWPRQENQEIKLLGGHENNFEFSKGFKFGRKEAHNTEYITKKWDLVSRSENGGGTYWEWTYIEDKFNDKRGNKRLEFAPREHGIKWKIFEDSGNCGDFAECKDFGMSGFRITIVQVLRFKFTYINNYISRKILLINCPTMSHSLEITFNSLANFNKNFAELRKDYLMKNKYVISKDDIISEKQSKEGIFNHSLTKMKK